MNANLFHIPYNYCHLCVNLIKGISLNFYNLI